MEKLNAFGNQIEECVELSGDLEWLSRLKVVANKETCTTDELTSAVEWLGNRNNANRATLALLNGQPGEDIIKQAKDIIEE